MNVKNLALGFMGFIIRACVLAIAIWLIVKTGKAAYDFGFRIFTEEAMSSAPGRDVAVTIVKGDSTMDVGKMFEEKGLIRDHYLFWVQKKCSVYDNDIQPGFYTLNTSMTADDMFAVIAGRKEAEGEENEEDGEDIDSAPLPDGAAEESALDKVSGEWEGSEETEEEAVHDPFEEGDDGESQGAAEGGEEAQ